jgi:hypothetical protein
LIPAPAAPLEASDPQRAQTLKRKVLDRITDVRRHLNALQTAMAGFGEDFDLDVFQAEFDSEEPEELNRVESPWSCGGRRGASVFGTNPGPFGAFALCQECGEQGEASQFAATSHMPEEGLEPPTRGL